METILHEIRTGQAPVHLKSLVRKDKPQYLVKTRPSRKFRTPALQLDLFYKSPI
ncbi:hypothetical protein [Pedobacter sp. JY14-1]|uniref:hypothetical protein n=1 Tax=Pedobacter sp. JY14-1 TaxID=3034151 RepID=UPI0023E0C403|nr:hypothetical protein [Pedobacter sp. JY14-1]